MTQQSPMQEAYTHLLHSYNPLEIKDILIHGASRKATHHKTRDDIMTYYANNNEGIHHNLLDAIGLEYKQCEDDDTQNEVLISLTPSEATDVLDQSVLSLTNEQTLAAAVLNHELSEYTTKATIYTPSGDKITFS